jgi:hypothetical protein
MLHQLQLLLGMQIDQKHAEATEKSETKQAVATTRTKTRTTTTTT